MTDDQPTFAMAADPLVGRVLDGRYRIVRCLAKGGMGRVYVAHQVGLDRTVALKVLSTEAEGGSESFRDRFFREARLCSRLTHPNTVRIFDYGRTSDDIYYIAMEFLDGATLGELLRGGPFEPLRAVALASQVCASLTEAHRLGLIHRDLKPDNLIVTQHGDGREFVRVVDFGIVKDTSGTDAPTQQGVVFGSPGYMSPEQLLEQPITPRSDIYSLGAILYRMVTGARPFGEDPAAALTRQVTGGPRAFAASNPSLPPQPLLEWVTLRCLEREPEARFGSVAELGRALAVCDLQLRGVLTLNRPLELQNGELVLPEAVREVLARFDGGTGPTPAAVVRTVLPPVPEPAEPTLPERRQQPLMELSQRLRHPVVLVVGGVGSMVMVPIGLVLLLVLLVLLQWVGRGSPGVEPTVPVGVEDAPVSPVPAVAPEGPPEPAVEQAAEEPPSPAPQAAPATRVPPSSKPDPVSADPEVPPDPGGLPEVPPEDDPMRRSDLRDPFADPR